MVGRARSSLAAPLTRYGCTRRRLLAWSANALLLLAAWLGFALVALVAAPAGVVASEYATLQAALQGAMSSYALGTGDDGTG